MSYVRRVGHCYRAVKQAEAGVVFLFIPADPAGLNRRILCRITPSLLKGLSHHPWHQDIFHL